MRIAAWVLIVVAFAACIWFAALLMRGCFVLAFVAQLNGLGTLQLRERRRPGVLWVVLAAGFLLVGGAVWHALAIPAQIDAEMAERLYVSAAAAQRDFFLRALLTGFGLGLTLVGWAAWLVNQRIRFNLDRS